MRIELTYEEIVELLKDKEETELLELLEIDSEMIVERFRDLIEDNLDKMAKEVV